MIFGKSFGVGSSSTPRIIVFRRHYFLFIKQRFAFRSGAKERTPDVPLLLDDYVTINCIGRRLMRIKQRMHSCYRDDQGYARPSDFSRSSLLRLLSLWLYPAGNDMVACCSLWIDIT